MKTKTRTRRLDVAVAEAKQECKGSKGIDKQVTTFKATTAAKDTDGTGSTTAVMEPTSEQLAKINEFTRSPKQASDLVVFSTLSCNDIWDRDDERFTTETVNGFAALESPFGPTGKSYMVGHDYTKLPVGRIFDTSAETVDGVRWLKNDVYIPNTDSNKSMIENIDFGVNWAVSVGVMLESAECSLEWCGATMYKSRFFGDFCAEGHDKGMWYTKDAETDSWGYPLPCDSRTSGAELCRTNMVGAKDFYELSQVFLGAQFYAALEKQPDFKGVIKAASAKGLPVIGLSSKEAEALEPVMPHMDSRAIDGMRRFGAKVIDDEGTLQWTDDNRLVWTYSPETAKVLCLGKSAESDDAADEEDGDGTATGEPESQPLGSDDPQPGSGSGGSDDGEGDDPADGGDEGTGEGSEGAGPDGSVDPSADDDSSEEKAVSKAAVLKSLRGLKAPSAVLSAVEGAQGDSLDAALSPLLSVLADRDKTITDLEPKAALGSQYVDSLKSEAINWYVKANQQGTEGVDTSLFQKMLDNCGDNVELVKGLLEMQKGIVQAKFPGSVRRSSFPSDPNEPTVDPVPDVKAPSNDKTVTRLHG